MFYSFSLLYYSSRILVYSVLFLPFIITHPKSLHTLHRSKKAPLLILHQKNEKTLKWYLLPHLHLLFPWRTTHTSSNGHPSENPSVHQGKRAAHWPLCSRWPVEWGRSPETGRTPKSTSFQVEWWAEQREQPVNPTLKQAAAAVIQEGNWGRQKRSVSFLRDPPPPPHAPTHPHQQLRTPAKDMTQCLFWAMWAQGKGESGQDELLRTPNRKGSIQK